MAKRKQQVEEAEVPLSSMIDVVFLLLIYFIVTQKPIIENTLLGVNLPSPNPGPPPKEKPQIFTVDVMKLRNPQKSPMYYHVNGSPWHIDDLREYLMQVAENDPEQTVIINCGPNAQHIKLIQLLDACAEAGLKQLNIVNDASVRFVPEN